MNKDPLVSIIIPTKNEEHNIIRCLKSIQAQNYKGKIEIIVVDNHSHDKTAQLARTITSHVVIAGPERSRQRNIGAKKAKGTWLLFVDADMELSKIVIYECLNLVENSIFPAAVIINEKSIGITFLGKAIALERNCYQDAVWLQAARFFPKKEFLAIGGYDENLVAGEDWDITLRFREKGYPTIITRKSHVFHHESKATILELFRKELYYVNHIGKYAIKHPFAFSYQGSFFYRGLLWIRSWKRFIQNPFLTLTFLSYKFTVWILWMVKKNSLVLRPRP